VPTLPPPFEGVGTQGLVLASALADPLRIKRGAEVWMPGWLGQTCSRIAAAGKVRYVFGI
jgi:hypothetical protein